MVSRPTNCGQNLDFPSDRPQASFPCLLLPHLLFRELVGLLFLELLLLEEVSLLLRPLLLLVQLPLLLLLLLLDSPEPCDLSLLLQALRAKADGKKTRKTKINYERKLFGMGRGKDERKS